MAASLIFCKGNFLKELQGSQKMLNRKIGTKVVVEKCSFVIF